MKNYVIYTLWPWPEVTLYKAINGLCEKLGNSIPQCKASELLGSDESDCSKFYVKLEITFP